MAPVLTIYLEEERIKKKNNVARAAGFIVLVMNNLRHTILSRLLNREGEVFKSNIGLFENRSFLPGEQVHRHSLTAQYNKN